MIGDYYSGARRERFMSLQTTVSASSAFFLSTLGGVIAEQGWRAPYAVFAASLLLAPLMVIDLWEPQGRVSMTAAQFAEDSRSFRPRLLAFSCVGALLTGLMFLTVPVHFGYLFNAIGVQSPSQIGLVFVGLATVALLSGVLVKDARRR